LSEATPAGQAFRRSLAIGLIASTLFSAWATVAHVLAGAPEQTGDSPSLSAIIATYYVAAFAASAVVAVLSRLGRSKAARSLIGTVVAGVVALCVGVTSDGWPVNWDGTAYFSVLMVWGMLSLVAVAVVNDTEGRE
jgi:xanthine/uracil permease